MVFVVHTVPKVVRRVLVEVEGLLQVARRMHFLRTSAVWSWRVALMTAFYPLALVRMRTARVALEIRPLPHGDQNSVNDAPATRISSKSCGARNFDRDHEG